MKLRIALALASVYIVWGSTYLAIRFAVETMPPFLMAGIRFLISGAALYLFRRMVGDPKPTRQELRSTAVVGLFMLLGGNGAVVWAEQFVPSGITALLIGSTPLWMVLIDALRPKGFRPNAQTVMGLLIGFGGIMLLVRPDPQAHGTGQFDILNTGVVLFAALSWAAGSIYSRQAPLPSSSLLATSLEMLIGGAGLMVFGTLAGDWSRLDLAAISARSYLGLGYLIVFGSLVGFVAYTWLLRNVSTALAATYAYVNPLVAIFVGNILGQEPVTPRIIIAGVVIVGSVFLINTTRLRRVKKPTTH